MSRTSNDQFNSSGMLLDGYDYDRQCWVVNGLYAKCGHPAHRNDCYSCCHAGEPYTQTDK